MKDLEQTIFGVICAISLVALVVVAVEQTRKVDVLTAQIKAMRQSMEDAGYVQAEPRIMEARR